MPLPGRLWPHTVYVPPETKHEGDGASKVSEIPGGVGELVDLTKSVELVLRYKDGDQEALDELFNRYWPRLRRVIRIRMGPELRQIVDADDLVQDTLLIEMRKLGDLELRTPASIMQWLSRIAEYQIKNKLSYLKAQRRDPKRTGVAWVGGKEVHLMARLDEVPDPVLGDGAAAVGDETEPHAITWPPWPRRQRTPGPWHPGCAPR